MTVISQAEPINTKLNEQGPSAQTLPPKLLSDDRRKFLVGTWKMVSWTVEDLLSGEQSAALGESPAGYITYSPEGRVMVLVLRSGRKKPADLVPTDAEKVALYDSMFAYTGTYSLEHEKVLHHVDMSWNEVWTGTTQIRFLKLRDDELTYTSAPAPNPTNGRDCVHTVVFRRAA